MKKIISLFTTLCIVFSMFGTFTVFADDTDITEISTLAELEAFRDNVNNGDTYEGKTVKLTADIDMSGKYGEGKESWTPIGTEEHPFNGTFKGLGHMIDNLYINSKNMNSGLFGHTENKSIINHLTVGGCMNVNTDTNKSQYAGAIVGHNRGIIDGCNNEASVNAIEALNGGIISGGIAGFNSNSGIIRKCVNVGTISTKTYLVGGICGRNFGLVEHCLNDGDVSGKYLIGGLCAQLMGSGRISNCLNIGSIDGDDCVGDMVGDDRIQVIDKVYYFMTYKPDETTSDIGTAKTAEQLASGEVAYLLGDEWGQEIGVDKYPLLGGSKVYFVNDTYTNTVPEHKYPYQITALRLTDAGGNEIITPEQGKSFIVEADIVKAEERDEKDYFFVAVYDENNVLMSLDYVKAKFAVDGECSFGFNIHEQEKTVGSVKAFVWNTFNSMEPLAETKTLTIAAAE